MLRKGFVTRYLCERLAFGLAQFSRLREDWLRVSGALFGHRYLMDTIVPGGVARDLLLAARDLELALGLQQVDVRLHRVVLGGAQQPGDRPHARGAG